MTRFDTEDIQAGRTSILLKDKNEFPTGMYTVCIEGLDTGNIVKKVIILTIKEFMVLFVLE